jgi:hypothetical protein
MMVCEPSVKSGKFHQGVFKSRDYFGPIRTKITYIHPSDNVYYKHTTANFT